MAGINSSWKNFKYSIKKKGIIGTFKKLCGEIFYLIAKPLSSIYFGFQKTRKDSVIFVSKPDYSDNSLYLSNYLLSHREFRDYHITWLVEDPDKYRSVNKDITFIKRYSSWHSGVTFKAKKALYQSRYIFFTHGSPMAGIKRNKSQIIINLWHGCGYKDIKSTDNWKAKNPFDYSLVPGKVFIDTKSHFWNCDKKQILPIGYPRYDEFKNVKQDTIDMFKKLKGDAEKVIIWMPTYRKTEKNQFAVSKIKGFFEIPILNSVKMLKELDDYCTEKKVKILIKRHHYQIDYKSSHVKLKSISFIDDIAFEKARASLYGFLTCVDALITDYSSIAIDFMLLDKPIGFTLDDFDAYKNTQGFVFENPLDYMPGSHIYNYEEMVTFIDDVACDKDPYMNKRHALMSEVHNPCDNYCERICKKFFRAE